MTTTTIHTSAFVRICVCVCVCVYVCMCAGPTSGTSCDSASFPTLTDPHAWPTNVKRGYRSGKSKPLSFNGTSCS